MSGAALPAAIIWPVLIFIFAAIFASDFSAGLLNGFFVLYAAEQHVPPNSLSLILSILNLAYIVTSLVTPFVFACMPAKRLLLAALLLAAAIQFVFGFAPEITVPTSSGFTTLLTGLQLVRGTLVAIVDAACLSIALVSVPASHTDQAPGWVEACRAVAYAAGPGLGALIYASGGYLAPFASSGTLLLLVLLGGTLLMCRESSNFPAEGGTLGEKEKDWRARTAATCAVASRTAPRLATVAGAVATLAATLVAAVAFNTFVARMHDKFSWPIQWGGAFLSGFVVLYIIFTVTSPLLARRLGTAPTIVIGLMCCFLTEILLANASTWGLAVLAHFSLMPIGAGLVIPNAAPLMLQAAEADGDSVTDLNTIIASLAMFSYTVGNACGQVLSPPMLTAQTTYTAAHYSIAGFCVLPALIVAPLCFRSAHLPRTQDSKPMLPSEDSVLLPATA